MTRLRIFICIVSLVLLAVIHGCNLDSESALPEKTVLASPPPVMGTIVCVGDSLTEGLGVNEDLAYPALLQRRFEKDGYAFKVVNAGISGETSRGTLSRINWILTLNPDIVILETGANDGFRGLDPDLIYENILATVRALKARDVVVVLAGMEMVRNLGKEYTSAFRKVYQAIAKEEAVILIPFFLEGVAAVPHLNRSDGIHPNAEGYQVVVQTIYPYVVEAIGRLER